MKIFIFILLIIFTSCNSIEKKYSLVENKNYYSNGNIKLIYHTHQNIKEGEILQYYPDGSLAVKGYFSNNLRDKKWIFYDKNTKKIVAIENYENGNLHGKQLYFYPKGNLKLSCYYSQNTKIGIWEYFTPEQLVSAKSFYFNNGHYNDVVFYENGKKISSGLLIDDIPQFQWNFYDDNEKILYSVTFEDGVLNGVWRGYNKDEKVIVTGFFDFGKLFDL